MSEEPASEGGDLDPTAGVADLAERVDQLADTVEALERDVDEKIEDVRARVIQVKREADAKAPADHDHPELAGAKDGSTEQLEVDLRDLRTDQERAAETIRRLEDRLEAGFANYEEVLEHLLDTADAVEGRIDRIVDAVVDVRERVARLEARRAERAAAERLQARALSQGVASAKCEDCGGGVQLGLLTAARCPHCEAEFADVETRGFLRSAVVRTGSRPALEEPGAGNAPALDDLTTDVDRSRPTMPEVGDEEDRLAQESETDATASDSSADFESNDKRAVDAVPGIGSAYAERLREAGVPTVEALAAADPDRLADEAEIAPARVETWVERARELDRPG